MTQAAPCCRLKIESHYGTAAKCLHSPVIPRSRRRLARSSSPIWAPPAPPCPTVLAQPWSLLPRDLLSLGFFRQPSRGQCSGPFVPGGTQGFEAQWVVELRASWVAGPSPAVCPSHHAYHVHWHQRRPGKSRPLSALPILGSLPGRLRWGP